MKQWSVISCRFHYWKADFSTLRTIVRAKLFDIIVNNHECIINETKGIWLFKVIIIPCMHNVYDSNTRMQATTLTVDPLIQTVFQYGIEMADSHTCHVAPECCLHELSKTDIKTWKIKWIGGGREGDRISLYLAPLRRGHARNDIYKYGMKQLVQGWGGQFRASMHACMHGSCTRPLPIDPNSDHIGYIFFYWSKIKSVSCM